MSLDLPASTPDLFSRSVSSTAVGSSPATQPAATSSPSKTGNLPQQNHLTLGGIFSAVLRDDVAIKKQMTPAEQSAVAAVLKNVGTPDEYGSALGYVVKALPYVRAVYSGLDVIQPDMPTNEEISILMRSRFLMM